MTKLEFKCIELYFDKHTQEKEDVYGNCYRIISGKSIDELLSDIATLVEAKE